MAEKYTYIYDMPYKVRQRLTDVLNVNDVWRDLAGIHLNYGQTDIENIRRAENRQGCSPADALLTKMGQKNHTTLQLFIFLYKMKHFQAMEVMKECVDPKYHKYIKDKFVAPEFSQTVHFPASTSSQVGKSVPIPPKEYQNAKNPNLQMDISVKKTLDPNKLSNGCSLTGEASEPKTFIENTFSTTDNNLSSIRENPNLRGAAYLSPTQGLNVLSSAQGSLSSGKTGEASCSRLKQRVPSGIPVAHPDIRLRSLTFEEVQLACNYFARSNLIGRGGFGEVYSGEWNGQKVAVKRIREDKRLENGAAYHRYLNQAITELYALHQYPAENILPLWAFHFDDSLQTDPCLVYQFMSNGSVSDRLQRKNNTLPLSWIARANIALGTARGLCHLHANNIIHGDIKSPNILLDKHYEPKIGDFGLARGGPDVENITHKLVTIIQGTESYLPYDYVRSHQLTPEVDTFCFGIFLFELVTGKPPSWKVPNTKFQMRDVMLQKMQPFQWIDQSPGEESQWPKTLYYLGTDCAKEFRQDRPKMDRIYTALDRIIRFPESLALQKLYDERNLQTTQNEERTRKTPTSPKEADPGQHSIPQIGSTCRDESDNIPVFLVEDDTPCSESNTPQDSFSRDRSTSYGDSSSKTSESSYSDSNPDNPSSHPDSSRNIVHADSKLNAHNGVNPVRSGGGPEGQNSNCDLESRPIILRSDTLSQNPLLASVQRQHLDFGIPDLPQFTADSDPSIPNFDVLGVANLSLSEAQSLDSDHHYESHFDDAMASNRLASAEVNIELAANMGIFK